jgi:2-polyprenyl-3-methyl-5-hydroxy-6-metoxy-1,4-benzoquinol methylase
MVADSATSLGSARGRRRFHDHVRIIAAPSRLGVSEQFEIECSFCMSQRSDSDLYEQALARLEALDRRLALAASVVDTLHVNAARVAHRVLSYAQQRFAGRDVVETYVNRARSLAVLQERFDANPTPETLGDPDAPIDRDVYNISLLLSIVFTNHRFEIMQQLSQFLERCSTPRGRIASIGTGTGYEIERMASLLPNDWAIESYDIDESVQDEARAFLHHSGITRAVHWAREFPLDNPSAEFRKRYDAIVMCELLEHLPDPAAALVAARDCLAVGGRLFATMAINIAQEDHIYLYRDIPCCQAQIKQAGLRTISEWITPQTTLPPAVQREANFKKGNYVAVLEAAED